MVIQLTYWKAVCDQLIGESQHRHGHRKNSLEEQRAFWRLHSKHRKRHYIRYL